MGKNTSFTCDRCGHTQTSTQGFGEDSPNSRFMYTLHLVVHQGEQALLANSSRYIYNHEWSHPVMWCSKCMGDMGMDTSSFYKPPAVIEPATYESIITEMIRETVNEVLDDRGVS